MCRAFQGYRELHKIKRQFEDIITRATALDEPNLWDILNRMLHGQNLFYDVNSYLSQLGAEQVSYPGGSGNSKTKVTRWFDKLKEQLAQLELLHGPYFAHEDVEEE